MIAHLTALFAALAYLVAAYGYVRVSPFSSHRRRVDETTVVATELSARIVRLRLILFFGLVCHLLFFFVTEVVGVPALQLSDQVASDSSGLVTRLPAVVSVISSLLIGLFLLLERPLDLTALGSLVAPLGFLLLLASAILFHLHDPVEATTDRGFLVSFHLLSIIVSYTLLTFSSCVSGMFLMQEARLKSKRSALPLQGIPSIAFLDRLSRLLVAAGFALLSIGIVFGVFSASLLDSKPERVLGRLLWVLPVIAVYGSVVFQVYIRGVRGKRIALLTAAGLLSVAISFFGSRLGGGGFHVH